MVSLVLEKLPIIRGDLVYNDPDWETWGFVKFTEALRQWTRLNPIDNFKLEDSQSFRKRDCVFQTQRKRTRKCVYCQAEDHKPSECTKITSPTESREFLASEFIGSLKRFIARRGRPEIMYSDNGSTFKAADKWLKRVQQDERFHDLLAGLTIKWQFKMSRAPWWGG